MVRWGRGWCTVLDSVQLAAPGDSPNEADCSMQMLVLKDSILIENLRPNRSGGDCH